MVNKNLKSKFKEEDNAIEALEKAFNEVKERAKNAPDFFKNIKKPKTKQQFYLIFKNSKHEVIFLKYPTKKSVLKDVEDRKLQEGAYRIIKGVRIV